MNRQVIIDRRFCGPPDSGNGGYVAGLLAGRIEGAAQVTLRRPPPLGVAMDVTAEDDGAWALKSSGELVALTRAATLDIEVPAAPSFHDARNAVKSYRGFSDHPFPGCFVCGPERDEGDGMRLFPSPIGDDGMVAATWTPDGSFVGDAGTVRPEFLWAVLDCPGFFAVTAPDQAAVLGTMTAHLERPVKAGARCIVIGWPTGRDGRKLYCGTALFTETGELIAKANHVWISVGRQ
ncbi:MAG: PaaI family thioesterase [Sphingomonadales bacterium]